MRNERTSKRVAAIAAKGLKAPSKLTAEEIKLVCASVLTQRPDRNVKAKSIKKVG